MPDPIEALALVRDDVERGMGDWLRADEEIDGAGFRLLEPFDVEDVPINSAQTGTVVIPWAWVGRHDGDVMGFTPTGRVIDLHGVTIVRDTDDGPRYSRFVDWVSALGQMGVGLFSRPVIDDGPPAA
ncbi:MAG: hypothetical protein ACRDZU_11905 [Acidimicrobiales bacterium]